MKPYIVKQGDYLAKIAHRFRATPEQLWDHPSNKALRELRPNPSVLFAGDVVHVPDAPPPPLELARGGLNTYVAEIPEATVDLVLLREEDRQPIGKRTCWIHGLGDPIETSTDDGGRLAFSAPVDVRSVDLLVEGEDVVLTLLIGALDPVTEISGAVQRLTHLRYFRDLLEGWPEELSLDPEVVERAHATALESAIKGLQGDLGAASDGQLTSATRDWLAAWYGS